MTGKRSQHARSLRQSVEREVGKCSRGFQRMATIVRRTEALIAEEQDSIAAKWATINAQKQADAQRKAEIEAKLELRKKLATDPTSLT